MIRLVLVLLLALAHPALGQTARVISGEHEGFTRLVVELPEASGWTVGRTPMGYSFAAMGNTQPDYDLGRVWDLIPRTRLQSLRIESDSGVLQLALACDCHVFPFEYRPGVVVMDIKDGPAPEGSAFEQPFSPGSSEGGPASAPDVAGYNWLADLPATPGSGRTRVDLPELATGSVSLEPLRDQLLAQISRGAAEGIVDMELPGKAPRVADPGLDDLPWTHIHIGELPGVRAGPGGGPSDPVPVVDCAPAAALDLPTWGDGQSPLDLLSAGRSEFYGEFDEVEVAAALDVVRRHLYLGFGAEARQYALLLPQSEAPPELAYYLSMSHLVEDESDPLTPFSTMLPCDGPAALWAAIAQDRLPPGPEVNVDAILRSFLALPAHLRQSLGSGLSEKMLDRGDGDAARLIRDSMERAPFANVATIALLDAKADLQADRPEAAQEHARAAVAKAGADVAPLVTLVEAHLRRAEPISPEVAESLLAVLGESRGRPDEAGIRRALILALALSGQTAAAFDAAEGSVPAALWQVAGQLAPDDEFLTHAVLPAAMLPPDVPDAVRTQIGRRLLDLGFADPALHWLGPVGKDAPPEERLLAAAAELARGDARAALFHLDGLDTPEIQALRARAHVQLGAYPAARAALLASGDAEASARLRAWEKDWLGLSAEAVDPWRSVTALVTERVDDEGAGPLARGAWLADEGARARAAVAALLAGVPSPDTP